MSASTASLGSGSSTAILIQLVVVDTLVLKCGSYVRSGSVLGTSTFGKDSRVTGLALCSAYFADATLASSSTSSSLLLKKELSCRATPRALS